MSPARTAILLLAVIATAVMVIYPPYIIAATGTDLGYHFALQKPAMVEALGSVNKGRLLLQLAGVWALAIVMVLASKR